MGKKNLIFWPLRTKEGQETANAPLISLRLKRRERNVGFYIGKTRNKIQYNDG
jgi:hypothetical protein